MFSSNRARIIEKSYNYLCQWCGFLIQRKSSWTFKKNSLLGNADFEMKRLTSRCVAKRRKEIPHWCWQPQKSCSLQILDQPMNGNYYASTVRHIFSKVLKKQWVFRLRGFWQIMIRCQRKLNVLTTELCLKQFP